MADDQLFYWAALAVASASIGISIYYRHRADKTGGLVARDAEPAPLRLGLSLCGLLGFGGLLLYFIWPPALAWTMLPVPVALRWSGVALGVSAAAVNVWVFRTLGLNVTRTVRTRENATLVTTGPYRFVRHPLYVSGTLTFLAISLVTGSWWFIAWVLPGLILLAIRTPQEEAHLAARFGDAWHTYAARTGRFLPRLAR